MIDPNLKPEYSDSYALIVGINKFKHASPLEFAINDAKTISETLINNFDFPKDHIRLLINKEATRSNIMSAYMSYCKLGTEINDRILVFYAGHGHTQSGTRGEIGFLVPHDGSLDDLSTLIRWDEFTFNAELIRAKHILFIMDACYSGLIFQRTMPAGSKRFLKDMLLRPVRQVITAGKADELVADSGGPIPAHSVFTGHLLNALDGNATTEEGVLTASGVMSYVYEKVSKDIHSRQTPHYGFFDGDGDFIFQAPILGSLIKEDKKDEDVLITISSSEISESIQHPATLVSTVKEYLADPKMSIKLHDISIQYVRKYLLETTKEKFPVQGVQFDVEKFTTRLSRYNIIAQDLKLLTSCLSYWGEEAHQVILQKAVGRSTDNLQSESGLVIWLALRWYPIIVITYSAGIAAVAAKNYDNLHSLFVTQTATKRLSEETTELSLSIGEAILELERSNTFKQLPGHERHYVPRSEYLYKLLQPDLDDLFFLGNEYEEAFDRFEVMLALTHADLLYQKKQYIWGPIGRFGWKSSLHGETKNPLSGIMAEAKAMSSSWPPLKAGFFGGSLERFNTVATEYEAMVKKLNWW